MTQTSDLQIDYLHVPLGVHLNVTSHGFFNIGGGLEFGIPLKGKLDMNTQIVTVEHNDWVVTNTTTDEVSASVELNDLKSPETGYYVTAGFMVENAFFEYAFHGFSSSFAVPGNDPVTDDCHVLSVGVIF